MRVLGLILFIICKSSAESCVCSDCVNTTNCTTGEYGHCKVGVHINVTTKQPEYIEQKCEKGDDLIINECSNPMVVNFTDLFEICCNGEYCNECPPQKLADFIDKKYLTDFYDLFPQMCRPHSSLLIVYPPTSSNHFSSILSESKSEVKSSSVAMRTNEPGTTPDMSTYVIVFVVMASLGILVLISVMIVIGLVISFVKRGQQRRVREVPYCANQAFADFNGESQSCSSNALTETRLLQTRTLVDDIRCTKRLGRGRFGCVFLGLWGQEEIAVKVYDSVHETEWLREVDIYSTYMLTHTNILKFISADKKETGDGLMYTGDTIHLWTCLEFHSNGNLQEYLDQKKCLELKEGFALATSFLDGLHFLHRSVKTGSSQKPGIAHRDIKSPNILIKADLTCCIGDLGLAVKQKNDTEVDIVPINKLSGTKRYLPPEVLSQTMNFAKFQCYVSSDIYSASLVLWEIFQCVKVDDDSCSSYKPPYFEHVSHQPSLEVMRKVVVTKNLRPSLKFCQVSDKLKFLIKILTEAWSVSPLARPSALNINKKLKVASDSLTD